MIVVESSLVAFTVLALLAVGAVHASEKVDERDAAPGEWGFRPKTREVSAVNPPNFSWRPQDDAAHYALEISGSESFEDVVYRAEKIAFNVHTPTQSLPAGDYYWRFRCAESREELSEWSRTRQFSLSGDATKLPLPGRETLLKRIPNTHPRLFIRPEDVAGLKERKDSDLKTHYEALVRESEELLAEGLSTEEPPL
jgi:hypothetical protein